MVHSNLPRFGGAFFIGAQVMVQRLVRYVQPKKFEELTGYTVKAVERKIEEVLEDESDARFLGTTGRVYKLPLLAAEARRVQAHLDYLEGQQERAA